MSGSKEEFFNAAKEELSRYFSESQVDYVLLSSGDLRIHFVAKRPRKTKFGDYRMLPREKSHLITFNRPSTEAERERSYLTVLHELAHALVYARHSKRRVSPHGIAWKSYFGQLITGAVERGLFCESLKSPLLHHAQNPSARSGSDLALERAFADLGDDSPALRLEQIPIGHYFRLEAEPHRYFQRGPLLRTRCRCFDLNQNEYRVTATAAIEWSGPSIPNS